MLWIKIGTSSPAPPFVSTSNPARSHPNVFTLDYFKVQISVSENPFKDWFEGIKDVHMHFTPSGKRVWNLSLDLPSKVHIFVLLICLFYLKMTCVPLLFSSKTNLVHLCTLMLRFQMKGTKDVLLRAPHQWQERIITGYFSLGLSSWGHTPCKHHWRHSEYDQMESSSVRIWYQDSKTVNEDS